jgi:ketosteroid isomerase-like protein
MDFATALQQHLDAIARRDLDAFMASIGDEAAIILPTGVRVAGRDTIREFHAVWFSDPDWTMHFETIRVVAGEEWGFALLDVAYHDLDASGQPYDRRYYLSLLFVLRGYAFC